MYISKFIVIGKENNYQKIYVPKYNSIVLVSAKMYITLCNLAMKYNGSEIDVTNKDFKDIKETPEYNILVKNNVFVENLNGLEERYRLLFPVFPLYIFMCRRSVICAVPIAMLGTI